MPLTIDTFFVCLQPFNYEAGLSIESDSPVRNGEAGLTLSAQDDRSACKPSITRRAPAGSLTPTRAGAAPLGVKEGEKRKAIPTDQSTPKTDDLLSDPRFTPLDSLFTKRNEEKERLLLRVLSPSDDDIQRLKRKKVGAFNKAEGKVSPEEQDALAVSLIMGLKSKEPAVASEDDDSDATIDDPNADASRPSTAKLRSSQRPKRRTTGGLRPKTPKRSKREVSPMYHFDMTEDDNLLSPYDSSISTLPFSGIHAEAKKGRSPKRSQPKRRSNRLAGRAGEREASQPGENGQSVASFARKNKLPPMGESALPEPKKQEAEKPTMHHFDPPRPKYRK